MESHEHKPGQIARSGDPLCGSESLHRPSERAVHSSRLDSAINHSYQRELRTQQRPEDRGQGTVTCELTIFGLGSHSATGEEWADNDNAGTSAEAQAFKRACSCFGLGRYLYYFEGTWVGIADRKRPKTVPQLAGWATPEGWRQGLRPRCAVEQGQSKGMPAGNDGNSQQNGNGAAGDRKIVREIERMERVVGKRMYRGLLKSLARVWNPREIQDPAVQEKVLAHMNAAERGLRRAEAARQKTGLAAYTAVLGSMKLSSLEQVDNLKTLQEIVMALEQKAVSKS